MFFTISVAIPRSVARIIKKCLKKNPKRRFHTMGQLKERLERHIRRFPLDHQSLLKEYLKASVLITDQKTVFMERDEDEEPKKTSRGKMDTSKAYFKQRRHPVLKVLKVLKVCLLIGSLLVILAGIEVLLVYTYGIPLGTQKVWILSTWQRISLSVRRFLPFI